MIRVAQRGSERPARVIMHVLFSPLNVQQQGSSGMCLGCDPTLADCPATTQYQCQPLIANLWTTCNGVTLPDGIYYDPQQTVTGQSVSQWLAHSPHSVGRSSTGHQASHLPEWEPCWWWQILSWRLIPHFSALRGVAPCSGTWSPQVEEKLRVAASRCGCNAAEALRLSLTALGLPLMLLWLLLAR